MVSHKDNYNLRDENAVFELAILSDIADREDQQDSSGYELKNTEGIVVLCDGMGGHEGGKIASTISTEHILKSYCEEYPCNNPSALLNTLAQECDVLVSELKRSDGEPMHAGSTLVSIIIQHNLLYWVSVGDSRIYICRGNELVQVTNDHIYKKLLEEQFINNNITQEEYEEGLKEGETLISFLGRKGLPYIDINANAFELQKDDEILLASDGLYKIVSDDSIREILKNFENGIEALQALQQKAKKNGRNQNRDNITMALIKIK